MGIVSLILGESGSGKSTSLRNLNPKDVLLIQAVKKVLPFRSLEWQPISKENPDGSVFCTDKSSTILQAMERTDRKIIIIDDFQYTLANEFMRRVLDKETGNASFQKYNEIAKNAWDVLMKAASLPDDVRVYILSHTQTDEFGRTKIKTIGKLLDEKITIEGLVTIVLRCHSRDGAHFFSTRNSGNDTVKSPIDLFDEEAIDNDLNFVDKRICEYFGISKGVGENV